MDKDKFGLLHSLDQAIELDMDHRDEEAKEVYRQFIASCYSNVLPFVVQIEIANAWQMLIANVCDRIIEIGAETIVEENQNLLQSEDTDFECEFLDSAVWNYSRCFGMEEPKLCMFQDMIFPRLKNFPAEKKLPIQTCLFHGIPGTGKTLFAKSFCGQLSLNTGVNYRFLSISPALVLSKWTGESEKAIQSLFAKANRCRPCVIFLDEIDALAPSRFSNQSLDITSHRVLTELLLHFNTIEQHG